MKKVIATLVLLIMVLSTFVLAIPAGAEEPMEVHATTPRTVIVELFTGAACGPCVNADYGLDDYLGNHARTEAIALVYHRSIPAADKLETSETINRQGWYISSGGASTPNMWVDGTIVRVGGFGTRLQGEQWFETQYNTRRASQSKLDMTVDGLITPSLTGTVWVNVTNLETPTQTNLYLHTVIVRKTYGPYNGGNGVQMHHMTVRKMLPSMGGESITLPTQGNTKQYTYNFDLSGDHSGADYFTEKDDMAVVAFVQTHNRVDGGSNRYAAEILQSVYKDFNAKPNVAPFIALGQVEAPAGATEDDDVSFKVYYRDPDDVADRGPQEAKVYFKNATSGVITHDLTQVISSNNWIQGKWLKYTTKLGPGTYTYRFNASDGEDFALGDDKWNATQVVIKPRNKVPVLSAPDFGPKKGDTSTKFRFDIMYRDADNDPPTEAKIVINDVGYTMGTTSTGPWTDWVIYYYETTLPVGDTHRFYYSFTDGVDSVRYPVATASPNWIRGPEVEPPNNEPSLTTPLFTPNDGTRATEFEFSIIYTDGEDDHPTVSYVYVDDVPAIMDPQSFNYVGGAKFTHRAKLDLGTHYFYFLFNDGKNEVRFPTAGSLEGPTVANLDPEAVISAPKANDRYTPVQYVPFSAVDSDDPEGDELSYSWMSDIDGALSSSEAFDMRLSEGTHTITLTVTDEFGGEHSTTLQVLIKPYMPAPFIEDVEAPTDRPVETDTVTYTVVLNNNGEARASGLDVEFYVDDVLESTDTVSVDIGLAVTVRFTWVALAGDHDMRWEIEGDSMDLVQTVTANSDPDAEISINVVGDMPKKWNTGKEVYFVAAASDANGDDLSYLWEFGDGATSTDKNPTHTYLRKGTYDVKLTVTDSRGGSTTTNFQMVVVKPSSDDSPGYGALLAACAMLIALLGAAAARKR